MTWVNAVVQGVLLGGFYALLACGPVADVRRDADHQPRPRRHRRPRRLPDHRRARPLERLAVHRARAGAAGDADRSATCSSAAMLDARLRSGVLVPLLTTFGLSIVIQNLLLEKFSPDVRSLGGNAGGIATASWQITNELSISALGALDRSPSPSRSSAGCSSSSRARRPGRQMRATAQDPDTAELVGIDSRARLRAGDGDRRRDRGDRGHVPRDALDVRPVRGADAADLRVRGGRDRRPRLALGHAGRAGSCSASRRRSARRSTRSTRCSPATSCSWPCSPRRAAASSA